MRGIILAGGTGSRLWPITRGVSKQLLPVHNKPLIYYPLGTLMLGEIRDFLIITTPKDRESFQGLLGTGERLGINIEYAVQPNPEGLAQAFLIGENFIQNENVALILGDNLFHGPGLGHEIQGLRRLTGAHIFGYQVSDTSGYGIAQVDVSGKVISIEEKPTKPKSNIAITGLYLYDSSIVEVARSVKPSQRGELEITSVNQFYLDTGNLGFSLLARGTAWLDAGTLDSLFAASSYVKIVEERQGNMISCLEEIAWRNGWITDHDLEKLSQEYGDNPYSNYVASLSKSIAKFEK